MKSLLIILTAALLLTLTFASAGCGGNPPTPTPTPTSTSTPTPTPALTSTDNCQAILEQSVVKIDETVLDMHYFVKMLRFYSIFATGNIDATTFPYQVLHQIENDELVIQAAPGLGIQVTADEVTETINGYLLISAAGEGNTTGNVTGNSTLPQTELGKMYQQWLDYSRLSDSEYRRVVEATLLTRKLKEHLKEKNVPMEAKQVHVYGIQFANKGNATEAENRLHNGEDFSTLAAQYSIDNTTRPYGGDLGWIPQGVLIPELDQAAFSLAVGSVSQPIETSQGYYMIKVSEIDNNRLIDDQYRELLASNELTNWFKEQRDSVQISEYLDQDKIACALPWLSISGP